MSEIRKPAPREIIPEARSERVKLSLTKEGIRPSLLLSSTTDTIFPFFPSFSLFSFREAKKFRLARDPPLPFLDRGGVSPAENSKISKYRADNFQLYAAPARKYKWKGNGTACQFPPKCLSSPSLDSSPDSSPFFTRDNEVFVEIFDELYREYANFRREREREERSDDFSDWKMAKGRELVIGVSRQKRSSRSGRRQIDRSPNDRSSWRLGEGAGIHCDAARVYFPFAASVERALQNEWATGVQSEARTPLRDRVMKNKHSASPTLPPANRGAL